MPTSNYTFPERLFKGLGAMGGIFATGRPFDVTTNTDLAREQEALDFVNRLKQLQIQGGEQNVQFGAARLKQLPIDQANADAARVEADRARRRQAIGQAANLFDFTGVEDPRGPINQFQNGEFPTMQVNANQPVANMLFGASAVPGLSVLGEIAKAMEVNPGIGQFDGVPVPLRKASANLQAVGSDGEYALIDPSSGAVKNRVSLGGGKRTAALPASVQEMNDLTDRYRQLTPQQQAGVNRLMQGQYDEVNQVQVPGRSLRDALILVSSMPATTDDPEPSKAQPTTLPASAGRGAGIQLLAINGKEVGTGARPTLAPGSPPPVPAAGWSAPQSLNALGDLAAGGGSNVPRVSQPPSGPEQQWAKAVGLGELSPEEVALYRSYKNYEIPARIKLRIQQQRGR